MGLYMYLFLAAKHSSFLDGEVDYWTNTLYYCSGKWKHMHNLHFNEQVSVIQQIVQAKATPTVTLRLVITII